MSPIAALKRFCDQRPFVPLNKTETNIWSTFSTTPVRRTQELKKNSEELVEEIENSQDWIMAPVPDGFSDYGKYIFEIECQWKAIIVIHSL